MGEVLEGYLDGFKDDRPWLPVETNRSEGYVFGWMNGRDDRIGQPRDSAENLRAIAARLQHKEPDHG